MSHNLYEIMKNNVYESCIECRNVWSQTILYD